MIREGYRDIMTLFGWPVGWAVILALLILLPLVWWDEHVTQPRYARKVDRTQATLLSKDGDARG